MVFLSPVPLCTCSQQAHLLPEEVNLGEYFSLICLWVKIMQMWISQLMINKTN